MPCPALQPPTCHVKNIREEEEEEEGEEEGEGEGGGGGGGGNTLRQLTRLQSCASCCCVTAAAIHLGRHAFDTHASVCHSTRTEKIESDHTRQDELS